MGWRRACLVGCLGLQALASGCEGSDRTADLRVTAARASPVEGPATAVCKRVARRSRIPVLCPIPGEGDLLVDAVVGNKDLEPSRCAYVTELIGAHPRGPQHVIFGGRCKPLPLRGRSGAWPPKARAGGHLRLVGAAPLRRGERRFRPLRPRIVSRAFVRGSRALVLAVAPYPAGGIHGGHYALVWNEGGHGYVLSSHSPRADAGRPPRPRELRALERMADQMTPLGS